LQQWTVESGTYNSAGAYPGIGGHFLSEPTQLKSPNFTNVGAGDFVTLSVFVKADGSRWAENNEYNLIVVSSTAQNAKWVVNANEYPEAKSRGNDNGEYKIVAQDAYKVEDSYRLVATFKNVQGSSAGTAAKISTSQANTFSDVQFEYGSGASSPIIKSINRTRAREDIDIAGGSYPDWSNIDQGTFYVDFTPRQPNFGRVILGNEFNGEWIYYDTNFGFFAARDGNNAAKLPNAYEPHERTKIAVTSDQSTLAICKDGGEDFASASTNGNLTSESVLRLGEGGTIYELHELRYYPRRMSRNQLELLTS
jgi:hypothetical protein